MTELWRPVLGYEGEYEVSSTGQVRSFKRKDPRILRPATNLHGYQFVVLCNSNGKKMRTTHSLVLEAFVGPRPDGHECLHQNDVKSDNRLENLRWGSRSENSHDAIRNGRHAQSVKTHCKNGHEFTPENTRLHSTGRYCRACSRDAANAYYRRKKAAS